jgi:uncharacterized protein with PIN domain
MKLSCSQEQLKRGLSTVGRQQCAAVADAAAAPEMVCPACGGALEWAEEDDQEAAICTMCDETFYACPRCGQWLSWTGKHRVYQSHADLEPEIFLEADE